jgi:hypothetical protein
MRDQLTKLQEYYNNNNSGGNAGTSPSPATTSPAMLEEHKLAQKQWSYCVQLAKHMYEVRSNETFLFYIILVFNYSATLYNLFFSNEL